MMKDKLPSHLTPAFWKDHRSYLLNGLQTISAHRNDPGYDADGSVTAMERRDYRDLGFIAWHLERDVGEFRRNLVLSAETYLKLYSRFDAGEPISESFISCIGYQDLFSAPAAGDFELAELYAQKLGGRPEIEEQADLEFTMAMGYLLKNAVLRSPKSESEPWLDLFDDLVEGKERKNDKNYAGYPAVYRSLMNRDLDGLKEGFKLLLAGHRRECKGNGFFVNDGDAVLCIWGLGLANLCRHQGLMIDPEDPLIPAELLI